MEYKFGEMNSAIDINTLAENLANEGDENSLYAMAAENGIQKEAVEAYLKGEIETLVTVAEAALGKIEVEEAEMKPQEILKDWIEYLKSQVFERKEIAIAVRQKGKSLSGMMAYLLKWSFGHQTEVPKEIMKAANVTAGKCTLGIPGMGTAKKLIREYYLEAKA